MQIHFKSAASAIIAFVIAVVFILSNRPALTEEQALTMIYGNYDRHNKYASWINISFPSDKINSYFKERKGHVKVISLQPYYENGKNKVFLLTKAIPTNIPFDCHACLPLIGAAVFVGKNKHWEIEAQNQFIMYDGEYGELPAVKLIQVGQDKFGLSLEFEHVAASDKELSILIPCNKSVIQAHKEIIYYENFHECEFSETIPCEAHTANVGFSKSNEGDYYNLKVEKFGTTYSDNKKKSMPVYETITYKFTDGRYKEINHTGNKY